MLAEKHRPAYRVPTPCNGAPPIIPIMAQRAEIQPEKIVRLDPRALAVRNRIRVSPNNRVILNSAGDATLTAR